MPLIKKDYAYREALEITAETFPDEDPSNNLTEALHVGEVAAWIVCEKSGKRYEIPISAWKSSDGQFIRNKKTSRGKIHGYLVIRTLYASPTPPEYIRGEVLISKEQLDALLDPQEVVGQKPSSETTSKGQPPARGQEAKAVGSKCIKKRKIQEALLKAITLIAEDLRNQNKPATPNTVVEWMRFTSEGKDSPYEFEPPIADCNKFWIDGDTLRFLDDNGREHERAKRSLERLLQQARQ